MLVEPPLVFFTVAALGVTGLDKLREEQQAANFAGVAADAPRYAVALTRTGAAPAHRLNTNDTATVHERRHWGLISDDASGPLVEATFTATAYDPDVPSLAVTPAADVHGRWLGVEVWQLPSPRQVAERVAIVAEGAAAATATQRVFSSPRTDAGYIAGLLTLGCASNQHSNSQRGSAEHATLNSVLDAMIRLQSIVPVASGSFVLDELAESAPCRPQQLPLRRNQNGDELAYFDVANGSSDAGTIAVAATIELTEMRAPAALLRCAAFAPDAGPVPAAATTGAPRAAHDALRLRQHHSHSRSSPLRSPPPPPQQQQLVLQRAPSDSTPVVSCAVINLAASDEAVERWQQTVAAPSAGVHQHHHQYHQQTWSSGSSSSVLETPDGAHPFLEAGVLLDTLWAPTPVLIHTEEAHHALAAFAGPRSSVHSRGHGFPLTPILNAPTEEETWQHHHSHQHYCDHRRSVFQEPTALPMDALINVAVVRTPALAAAHNRCVAAALERQRRELEQEYLARHADIRRLRNAAPPLPPLSPPMKVINAYGEEIIADEAVANAASFSAAAATDLEPTTGEVKAYVEDRLPAALLKRYDEERAETVAATCFSLYDLCRWVSQVFPGHGGAERDSHTGPRVCHEARDNSATILLPLVSSPHTSAAAAMQRAEGEPHDGAMTSNLHLFVKVHSLPWLLQLVRGRSGVPWGILPVPEQRSIHSEYPHRYSEGGKPGAPSTAPQPWGLKLLSRSMIAAFVRGMLQLQLAKHALATGPKAQPRASHAAARSEIHVGRKRYLLLHVGAGDRVAAVGRSPSPPSSFLRGVTDFAPAAPAPGPHSAWGAGGAAPMHGLRHRVSPDLVGALLRLQHFQLAAVASATTTTSSSSSSSSSSGRAPAAELALHQGARYCLWSSRRCARVLRLLHYAALDFPLRIFAWEDTALSCTAAAVYALICFVPQLALPFLLIGALYFLIACRGVGFATPKLFPARLRSGDECRNQDRHRQQLTRPADHIRAAMLAVCQGGEGAEEERERAGEEALLARELHAPDFLLPRQVSKPPSLLQGSFVDAGYRTFAGRASTLQRDFGENLFGGSGAFTDSWGTSASVAAAAMSGKRRCGSVLAGLEESAAVEAELSRVTAELLRVSSVIADTAERIHGVLLWRAPAITALVCAQLVGTLLILLASPSLSIAALIFGLGLLLPWSPIRFCSARTLALIAESPALAESRFVALA